MRAARSPVAYLVGTPRARWTKREKAFLQLPGSQVQEAVEGKRWAQEGELSIRARSPGRQQKERALRRRGRKRLWERLQERPGQPLPRDELLLKWGAARAEAGRASRRVAIRVARADDPLNSETFPGARRQDKLRQARRSEGHDLRHSNRAGEDPARLWQPSVQVTKIEAVFRDGKSPLAIRPISPQKDSRLAAHLCGSFLAYGWSLTLRERLRPLAPGLTPRAVLEKRSALPRVAVRVPTPDGRVRILPRYPQPEKDQRRRLPPLGLPLPAQPAPRIIPQSTGYAAQVQTA